MPGALVIGAGPAGLMAAEVLARQGIPVTLCDAKPSFGRKFLMAGKSGLNLTMAEPPEIFRARYHEASDRLAPILRAFGNHAVQDWARGLGQELFTGSTGRVFPVAMKASPLLRAWLARLDSFGVVRRTRWQWQGWEGDAALFATPEGPQRIAAGVTVLALGGASWARLGSDGRWSAQLAPHVAPFAPANAAVGMQWTAHMTPHFGQALKSVAWQAGDQSSRGEAILSARGLEGGGLYALTPALRQGAPLTLDLVPDRPAERLQHDLDAKPRDLRLAHWLRNTLRLPPVKTALFFEMTAGDMPDRTRWVESVKALPIRHAGLRPMDEAISTAGGVRLVTLNADLMLNDRPGVFCAGEMLDWEAPTGGYLITASLATGAWAGAGAARYLAAAA